MDQKKCVLPGKGKLARPAWQLWTVKRGPASPPPGEGWYFHEGESSGLKHECSEETRHRVRTENVIKAKWAKKNTKVSKKLLEVLLG